MIDLEKMVPLGEVARPHSVRGELKIKVYNEDSQQLLEQAALVLRSPEGQTRPVHVEQARRNNKALLLRLRECTSREDAEVLRGHQLLVRRGDFPELEPGEFYATDIEGAEVFDPDGKPIGKVIEYLSYPSCEALLIAEGKERWELPLVEGLVLEIDAEAGRVVADKQTLEELDEG